MSGIYCPLTNGVINYETCANCEEMLCKEEIVPNKKIKIQRKKKKQSRNDNYEDDIYCTHSKRNRPDKCH